jgi:chloride channel protein, CIC family
VLFFLLGAVVGPLAVAYNYTLLGAIAVINHFHRPPVEVRAALIGAGVGVLAWFTPDLIGGGESLAQQMLRGGGSLAVVPLAFLLRFGLGAVSYAARTPGGLFAPILALGAQFGLLFGAVCRLVFPGLDASPEAFAVVGMAAFFTGVVRAPVTGIVLIAEMTGSFTMLLPMIAACFMAMLIPTLLGNAPIYDSLAEPTTPKPVGRQRK